MPIAVGKSVNCLPTKFTFKAGQIYPRLRTPALKTLFRANYSVLYFEVTNSLSNSQELVFCLKSQITRLYSGELRPT